ncbi:protein of unknown function [Thermomonospora echinospora]|uniref:DUF397 domain-containing protein n=1 Tax=Thermomonospora echinospora TaxID=1992 RepID=A0A1H6B341_9ACTN|nr:protein of unknown function [Thermomonospora echinospora]
MIIHWRKSSHSSGVNDAHCVEVGRLPQGVGVRDSKNPAAGHLNLSADQFTALLAQIKRHPPTP